jgi:hypothetical protein
VTRASSQRPTLRRRRGTRIGSRSNAKGARSAEAGEREAGERTPTSNRLGAGIRYGDFARRPPTQWPEFTLRTLGAEHEDLVLGLVLGIGRNRAKPYESGSRDDLLRATNASTRCVRARAARFEAERAGTGPKRLRRRPRHRVRRGETSRGLAAAPAPDTSRAGTAHRPRGAPAEPFTPGQTPSPPCKRRHRGHRRGWR